GTSFSKSSPAGYAGCAAGPRLGRLNPALRRVSRRSMSRYCFRNDDRIKWENVEVITPRVSRGRPLPLGTTAAADGINFALLCRHGTRVVLVLSPIDSNKPFAEIELNPRRNRTGDHWHVLV